MRTINSGHTDIGGTGITNFTPVPKTVLLFEAAVAIFNLQQGREVVVISNTPLVEKYSIPTDYSLHRLGYCPNGLSDFWKIFDTLRFANGVERPNDDLATILRYAMASDIALIS